MNRENSLDSRLWEKPYIICEDITGKMLFSFRFPSSEVIDFVKSDK